MFFQFLQEENHHRKIARPFHTGSSKVHDEKQTSSLGRKRHSSGIDDPNNFPSCTSIHFEEQDFSIASSEHTSKMGGKISM